MFQIEMSCIHHLVSWNIFVNESGHNIKALVTPTLDQMHPRLPQLGPQFVLVVLYLTLSKTK